MQEELPEKRRTRNYSRGQEESEVEEQKVESEAEDQAELRR